jgi:hypothetical protein
VAETAMTGWMERTLDEIAIEAKTVQSNFYSLRDKQK